METTVSQLWSILRLCLSKIRHRSFFYNLQNCKWETSNSGSSSGINRKKRCNQFAWSRIRGKIRVSLSMPNGMSHRHSYRAESNYFVHGCSRKHATVTWSKKHTNLRVGTCEYHAFIISVDYLSDQFSLKWTLIYDSWNRIILLEFWKFEWVHISRNLVLLKMKASCNFF